MSLPKEYAITDSKRYDKPLEIMIESLLKMTNVKMIQLREKHLKGKELYEIALKLRKITYEHSTLLFINERFDIAIAVSADGVHLPENSFPPSVVKGINSNMLVGFSAHSIESALYAEKDGADFITLSPIFRTRSHPETRPLGLDTLEEVCKKISIPIFALGGINEENFEECFKRGAYGIAGISFFFDKVDLK